jgi:hypothetical protein
MDCAAANNLAGRGPGSDSLQGTRAMNELAVTMADRMKTATYSLQGS